MNSNSDSGSGSSGSLEVTAKQGGGPRTPPDSHSADFDTSAPALSSSSDTPSKRQKRMERDERMAYLEDTIKNKDVDIRVLSKEIAALVVEQLAIRRIPEASRDIQLLVSIEEAIADMRNERDRLVAEIADLKTKMSQLEKPQEPDAPVPAQGM